MAKNYELTFIMCSLCTFRLEELLKFLRHCHLIWNIRVVQNLNHSLFSVYAIVFTSNTSMVSFQTYFSTTAIQAKMNRYTFCFYHISATENQIFKMPVIHGVLLGVETRIFKIKTKQCHQNKNTRSSSL